MTTDELAVANAVADEIENQREIRVSNAIGRAFDPGES